MSENLDVLNRYLFEDLHVRGEIVQLKQSFADIIGSHNYPEPVTQLLGELLAATSLLTATLKFEGEISVQLQGDGPVSFAVINGNHQQQMRGVAQVNGPIAGKDLKALMGNKANMVITIMPKQGERYQGIVALQGDTLSESLEHYFETSEQLTTKIWLDVDVAKLRAAGMLLQVLPDSQDKQQQHQDFDHISQLTATVKSEELHTLDAEQVLYRLYHQEKVRVFEPQPVVFKCSCSEDKCLAAITNLSKQEIEDHIEEYMTIDMTCDYCQKTYHFDRQKLQPILNPQTQH
ncbi:Hsp33 family molecular chaperone HslO [Thalassotalea sp. PS06]|uniref:Hsp33 family molecular chaperone HslO n=1 Tax=Thalassotalea sp. PS06 TaxID=2594005 RepID=UPI001164439B|nr:Hsp33 family molecular chaperone HslO [Thalassotalea sp. PS06]QDP00016.1 Hsp33 family molecular chaperone HslO [Thalassotalea sp. PS06]